MASDGTLTVSGTGCNASSPVSFRLWDTGGGPLVEVDSSTSGATANGAGSFTHGIPLGGAFVAGSEVGVVAVCQPTFVETGMSNPLDDDSYVLISLPDPVVEITVAALAPFASRPTVTVATSDAPGSVRVRLDGTEIYASGTGWGSHSVRLPASLALGSHSIVAEFDPTVSGAPTVTDTATVVIGKATSTLALTKTQKKKVKVGKKVKLKVVLASVGPLVGKVVIKDGRKVRGSFVMKPAHHGIRTIRVNMPKAGKRKLRAYFAGNGYVLGATSPKLTVRVVPQAG